MRPLAGPPIGFPNLSLPGMVPGEVNGLRGKERTGRFLIALLLLRISILICDSLLIGISVLLYGLLFFRPTLGLFDSRTGDAAPVDDPLHALLLGAFVLAVGADYFIARHLGLRSSAGVDPSLLGSPRRPGPSLQAGGWELRPLLVLVPAELLRR